MTSLPPPALHVPPTYRRPRLWPWVVLALVLLAVGVAEVVHRRRPAPAPAVPAATGPRAVPDVAPPSSRPATAPPARPPAPDVRKAGIAGRVLTPDGRPAAAVVVVVVAGTEAESASGPDGSFQLEAEDGKTVRLEAHHSDIGFASAEVRAPAVGVELRLRPRAGLDVRVLAEGRPLPEATITVQQQGGGALFRADRATDDGGLLRFLGLPAGALSVEALLPATGARSSLVVDAREGEVTPVTLLLPAVGVVRGTVVTRAGDPVGGAFVGVEEAEGLPARTGADGSFELRGLPIGREFRLTARTPELALDVPVSARAGQSGVRLVVRERPLYRGRVVGPTGAPLTVFSIEGRELQAADGRFATPLDTRDGQLELRVSAPGMLTRTVRTGATLSELGDIALQPAPRVEGSVRLAGGQPVPGALVTAGPDSTRSRPDGTFVLEVREPPLPGAALFVHATQGELAGSAEVPLGTAADIVLAAETPVRVRVFRADGAPAPGRSVQLAGPRTYAWTTDAEGLAAGQALAGDYRVSTDAQPGRVWFVRLPGSEVTLGAPAGSVALEVSLETPVEALWIERGAASAPAASERPGPHGEGQLLFGVKRVARFDGLSPGTWTVVAVRRGKAVIRTVQVPGATRLAL